MSRLTVCRLGPSDIGALSRLLEMDVLRNAYLRSELRMGLGSGTWWGLAHGAELSAVLLGGPLVVPWVPEPDDGPRIADALRHQAPPRMIVGPRESVLTLHEVARPRRDPEEVRDPQPLLALRRGQCGHLTRVPVRRGTRADLDALTLAAAAMHREEMGVDPLLVDAAGWRARMTSLIDRGWSYVWMEGGEVIFKVELSAWTPEAVQLQGVYTAHGRRHQGVGTAGMASVCADIFREVPLCSLYVNAYNEAALRLYSRLGFEPAGNFATVIY
ncbi:MAG: GNAT family N-acetyltransferase [Candidatus Dormibacteria bacterium]